MRLTARRLVELAMANPINAELTARLPALGLDQCLLTAGCLFPTRRNGGLHLP